MRQLGRWNQSAQLASIYWDISGQLGPWNQLAQLTSIGHIAPIGPMEPIGPISINSLGHIAPIGPVDPIGPIIGINSTYRANWADGTVARPVQLIMRGIYLTGNALIYLKIRNYACAHKHTTLIPLPDKGRLLNVINVLSQSLGLV